MSDVYPRRQQPEGVWNYRPEEPFAFAPLFERPIVWRAVAQFYWRSWLPLTERSYFLIAALAVWMFWPSLEPGAPFDLAWALSILLRNYALTYLVAGGLHAYFYRWRLQGAYQRFDARPMATRDPRFAFGDQVQDNKVRTLASGVPIWTAYECLALYALAQGWAPSFDVAAQPFWFATFFLLIPIWQSLHVYWIHRLLHWEPLYRAAHAVHHKNVAIGPWSGLSMHPIDHLLYFTSLLVHFVLPSHPLHVIFHAYFLSLGAVCGHAGYRALLVGDQEKLRLGAFFHQLHHRYGDCNFGNLEIPLDRWFGSFHDGAPETTQRLRRARRGVARDHDDDQQ